MLRWIGFVLAVVALVATPAVAQKRKANLLLVLAMDVSQSVDAREYELQREGYVAALSDPEIAKLMAMYNGTGLIIFEWSLSQAPIVSCLHVRSPADALQAAQAMQAHTRTGRSWTRLGSAMVFAEKLVDECDIEADQIVLDISGDGKDNNSPPEHKPIIVRDRLVAKGWRINTLPIGADSIVGWGEDITVLEWFLANVNGGNGNFAMPVENYEQLAGQLRRKLVLEISQARSYRYAVMQ